MLLDKVNKLLMVYVSSANNNHVLTEIVALVEVNDHLAINLTNIVDITEDRLAHHMISKAVKVDILHQGLLRVLVCSFQFLPDRILLELQVIVVINTIAEHIAKDLDRLV